ncbi:MAG: acyl-CoA thioesterase [Roseiflexus sp.]
MSAGERAETRMVFPVFPTDTNHYRTLFGGKAVAWIDQAAFICATRWCRRKVVTVRISEVNFHYPIREGSIVEVIARLVRTGRSSMQVAVDVWWEPMDHEERLLACQATCVLVALDDQNRPVAVPPLTEAMS